MKDNIKLSFVSFLSAALLVGALTQAHADTDYHCLNLCMNGGKAEAVCMPQCSYARAGQALRPGGQPKPATAPLSNHRILDALQPIDHNNILLNPPSVSPYHETKNYHCIAQCLQNKLQYETCERGCTIVTLKNGEPVTPQLDANTGIPYKTLNRGKP